MKEYRYFITGLKKLSHKKDVHAASLIVVVVVVVVVELVTNVQS